MTLFVITCTDKPGQLATRLQHRPDHLSYMKGQGETVKLAGPFLTGASGDPCGSLIIVETADIEAAQAFAAGDPYAAAGVFESVDIRPWRLTLGALA